MAFDPLEPYGPLIETRARIVTWNVWANSGPWEQRFARIEQLLRGMDPDIVAMQEVWKADGHEPLAEIADHLGLHYTPCMEWFEPARLDSGTAVLSRWPVSETHHRRLEGFDGGDGGLVQFARDRRAARSDRRVRRDARLASRPQPRASGAGPRARRVRERRPATPRTRCSSAETSTPDPRATRCGCSPGCRSPRRRGSSSTTRGRSRARAATATPGRSATSGPRPRCCPTGASTTSSRRGPACRGAGHPVRCEVLGAPGLDGVDPSDHFAVMAEIRY